MTYEERLQQEVSRLRMALDDERENHACTKSERDLLRIQLDSALKEAAAGGYVWKTRGMRDLDMARQMKEEMA